MALLINQFALQPTAGLVTLLPGNVVSAQVVSTQATALNAGDPVKFTTTSGGVPQVASLAANTDVVWGFVVFNQKDQSYAAGARVEIALVNSVLYAIAGAAISPGAKVEAVAATGKVITSAGVNPVCGYAMAAASGDGALVPIYVLGPYLNPTTTDASIMGFVNVVTLAELNAGKTLISVPTGKKAVLTYCTARCSGAFTTLTAAVVSVGATAAVSLAQAGMTDGAVLVPGQASNVTLGAAFGIAGADGADIVIAKTGSTAAGGTSITITGNYFLVDA